MTSLASTQKQAAAAFTDTDALRNACNTLSQYATILEAAQDVVNYYTFGARWSPPDEDVEPCCEPALDAAVRRLGELVGGAAVTACKTGDKPKSTRCCCKKQTEAHCGICMGCSLGEPCAYEMVGAS